MDALDPERYDVVPVGISREGRWISGDDPLAALISISPMFQLTGGEQKAEPTGEQSVTPVVGADALMPGGVTESVDVFFPALHGPMGEDGTIQGMLELAGLPYVGSGVLGSAASMDKAMTKVVMTQAGIPQLPWILVLRRDWERDADAIEQRISDEIGFPCFVKPANLGSSVGITKARDVEDLRLDCDVERRGGLVGDDQLRIPGDCGGDQHPLSHPARDLVRVGLESLERIGDPHLV